MQQQMSGLLRVVHIKQKSLQHVTFQILGQQHLTQAITLFLHTFCHKFKQSVTLDLFYNNISSISPAIFFLKLSLDIKLYL